MKADTTLDTVNQHVQAIVQDSAYYQYKLDSMRIATKAQAPWDSEESGPEAYVPFAGMLVPLVAIAMSIFLAIRAVEAKRAVRLAAIEKGMDPSMLFNEQQTEDSRKFRSLRFGLLLGGIGLGLLIGAIFVHNTSMSEEFSTLVIFASAFLFGGLGLVIFYLLASKLERENK